MNTTASAIIAEGRELLAKATPGPWNHLGYCGQDGVIQGPRQVLVASAIAGKTSGATGHQAFDDAALIVWLRNNAEALLDLATPPEPQGDEVTRLREALADILPGKLIGESHVPPYPDNDRITISISWGQLRRARQALGDSQ